MRRVLNWTPRRVKDLALVHKGKAHSRFHPPNYPFDNLRVASGHCVGKLIMLWNHVIIHSPEGCFLRNCIMTMLLYMITNWIMNTSLKVRIMNHAAWPAKCSVYTLILLRVRFSSHTRPHVVTGGKWERIHRCLCHSGKYGSRLVKSTGISCIDHIIKMITGIQLKFYIDTPRQ